MASAYGGGQGPRTYAQPMGTSIPAMSPMDAQDFQPGMSLDLSPLLAQRPIEKLTPGSELHGEVIKKLEAMFKFSQQEMSNFTERWQWMEQKVQAYIKLPDYKQAMQSLQNNMGQAPEVVKIVVPYSYATIHAAATFLFNVLFGRRPVFPLMASGATGVDKARFMEQAVQANLEACKGYEVGWQHIWDSLVYMFGAARIGWQERNGKMLRMVGSQREVVTGLKYAGNKLINIDPYNYRPDPRVPLHECNERGDFVFWVTHQSKMILKEMERNQLLMHVDAACSGQHGSRYEPAEELPAVADSQRRARIGAAGTWAPTPADVIGFVALKEGTVRLVPKDWKLGDGEAPELWKFMWNRRQIIQAEPMGMVHERHPVSVTEPSTLGHEFGSLSFGDMIGPFQDLLSWLVNSRMENVRTTLNNQFAADPSRVEMQDFRQPAPGKVIRLKQTAIGTPIKEALFQIPVQDVTQGHFADMQNLRTLADSTTGINDNMRGIQTQGGRRSATEARMSMQAGASRLSQMAVRISSQSLMEMAEQMISNIQQFMPDEMWVQLTGDDGQPFSELLKPEMVMGTFQYQISDGALPYDKMALIEVWKEILFGIARDPELRQRYDLGKIFEYVSMLGGAKNISTFNRQAGPQMSQNPATGAVPVGAAMPAPPGLNPFGAAAGA